MFAPARAGRGPPTGRRDRCRRRGHRSRGRRRSTRPARGSAHRFESRRSPAPAGFSPRPRTPARQHAGRTAVPGGQPARPRPPTSGRHQRPVRQHDLGAAQTEPRKLTATTRAPCRGLGRDQRTPLGPDERLHRPRTGPSPSSSATLVPRIAAVAVVAVAGIRFVSPTNSATNRRLRAVVQLGRRGDLLETPGRHHADPVAHRERLLLVVGDEQGRDPDHDLDPADLLTQLAADLRVERRQRLVEEQDAGLDRERRARSATAAAAARHLVRVAVRLRAEADEVERLLGLPLPRGAVDTPQAQAVRRRCRGPVMLGNRL